MLAGSGEARLLGELTVISADSRVAASSTVEVTGVEGELGAQLVALEGTFLDASSLLRERCGARRGDLGTFTGVVRGDSCAAILRAFSRTPPFGG